ncbi:MAG: type II secretion system protein [Chloroflexi bacterium]|nr:type II secretion system protein [Chloroflexota bacterium]
MSRIGKAFHYGEKGFTLIELLIVIAVLGVLAGVAVPNVSGFLTAGKVQAANTESANVETGAQAYYGANGSYPANSDSLTSDYISGTLKAKYYFSSSTGKIGDGAKYADLLAGADWADDGLNWDISENRWTKGVENPEDATNGTATKP